MLLAKALRAGLDAVRRSKRLLFLAALVTALVSLPFAFWMGRKVHEVGSHRPDAREIAESHDPDFFADVRSASPGFDADATALVVAALVISFCVRPLIVGGFIGIAAAGKRIPFSQFVREGGHQYWKLFRVAILQVVLLYLVTLALKPLQTWIADVASRLPSQATALQYRRAAELFAFACCGALAMVFEYARVGLRMHRSPGVLREIGLSFLFVLQSPFRTGMLFVVASGLEIAVLALLIPLLRVADGSYVATSIVVLVLGQVLVTLREACRLFHVAGAWHLRRADEEGRTSRRTTTAVEEPDLLEAPLPWNVR